MICLIERGLISKVKQLKISFYNFQAETVVMLTSAKNTGCSEVPTLILELLSEMKSDCHEILSGALVCRDL